MNAVLFLLWISASGCSFRTKENEYVWRSPEYWTSDEAQRRALGMPVILFHPQAGLLDRHELSRRILGTVIYSFAKPDVGELWAVGRLIDIESADTIAGLDLSTSPAVAFTPASENKMITLESGERLLIEGRPALFDHVAICEAGVWDKGGPPSGVEINTETRELENA